MPAPAPQVPPPPPAAPEPIRWTQVRPRHLLPSLHSNTCCVPTCPVQPGNGRLGRPSSVLERVIAEVSSPNAMMLQRHCARSAASSTMQQLTRGCFAASVTLTLSSAKLLFRDGCPAVSVQAVSDIRLLSALATHCSGLQSCARVPPRLTAAHRVLRGARVARRQAVAGAGVLAAGAYGVHTLLTPRVTRWYRTWRHGEAPLASDAQPGRATAELVAAALKEQVGRAPASRAPGASVGALSCRRRGSGSAAPAAAARRRQPSSALRRCAARAAAARLGCIPARLLVAAWARRQSILLLGERAAAVRAPRAGGGGARGG